MAERSLTEAVAAANASLTDPERNTTIGTGSRRFELYHFALSVCSHKVRTVLAEKTAPYISHDIGILPPRMENYHPDYVRLRLRGASGRDYVDGYTGRSSTSTEGFDPCVVPTLVDHETGQVIADSRLICEHIDRHWTGGVELLPGSLRRTIDAEIAIVDGTPHVAVLYGAHPDGDFRPGFLQKEMPHVHDFKIMKLMEGRALAVGHPRLIAAYDAKIRKEAAARRFVRTPALMREATSEIIAIIADLETRLQDGRTWICGESFTMADIQWAVSLFRLKWLGLGFAWAGGHALNRTELPHVGRYAKRLFERPSFQRAVIHWPGNPPSEFVAEYYQPETKQEASGTPAQRRPGGHGRDIKEQSLTGAVLETLNNARSARAKRVLEAFARHLHAFLEEVEPTEAEWEYGIEFLTRTGHLSKGGRQEFVLLSDVMGATARVDLINHRYPDGATENSVLGPFYVEDRPSFPNGADISAGIAGVPLAFVGRVKDTTGAAVAGARVDVWHSDDDGAYDIMMAKLDGLAMRGLFRTDHDGQFWFTSIMPTSYPIPDDGTVGELMHAANRSNMRPGHVHVRIEAPGFERLTTSLFIAGDAYLDSDPVFGVKSSLIVDFVNTTDLRLPDGSRAPSPCNSVDHDFILAKKR